MTARGRRSSELADNSELSPLSDRLTMLLVVRVFMAASVVFAGLLLGDLTLTNAASYVALGYVACAILFEVMHRFLTKVTTGRWIHLVNLMLLLDGVFVAFVLASSGESRSAFMFLAYAHIVSVTLLIGFRTGLKMAGWHSMLLLSVYYLSISGSEFFETLTGTAGKAIVEQSNQLEVAQATALWLVAIVTSVFSGLNERELRRRKGELTIIANLATEIEKTRRPAEIVAAMNYAAVDKLNANRAASLVLSGGSVIVVGTDAERINTIDSESLRALGGNIELAADGAKPVLIKQFDAQKDKYLSAALPGAQNVAIVPMIAEGDCLGVLVVEWGAKSRTRVTRATIELLSNVAGRVALSLSNTFLLAEVQRLASVDGLTNLANRRTFNITIEREVARALRHGTSLSLVILDIDHFKRVNDTYGHQMGDSVIAESAAGVAGACRKEDLPARYGGEEIVVIMPNCTAEEAPAAAERIRQAMADANVTLPGITASAGVATLVDHALDAEALLSAADQALYSAKESGRNKTCAAVRKPAAQAPRHQVPVSAVADQSVTPSPVVFE